MPWWGWTLCVLGVVLALGALGLVLYVAGKLIRAWSEWGES